jgi:hypothetical protein
MSNNMGREIAENAFGWGIVIGAAAAVFILWAFNKLVW